MFGVRGVGSISQIVSWSYKKLTWKGGSYLPCCLARQTYTHKDSLIDNHYITFIYGLNCIFFQLEIRLYLTAVGIISVGMGIVMGVGLASLLGYPYTPIHSALPFLCLGKYIFIFNSYKRL